MEDEEIDEETTVEGNEGTGEEAVGTVDSEKNSNETIEEKAQKLADGMLKKKMKNMPSKEELKRFRAWEKSQKSKEDSEDEKETVNNNNSEKAENALKENLIFRKGITDPETVEFLSWKISKMDGDFEENLEDFLEENPNYVKNFSKQDNEEQKRETTGMQTKKGGTQTKSGVDAILKSRHPDLFKD